VGADWIQVADDSIRWRFLVYIIEQPISKENSKPIGFA
jgi:hypothetical protein